MSGESNGWMEYKRLVLKQLEDLTDEVQDLRAEVTLLRVDVGNLKGKAVAWGAVAAIIVSGAISLLFKL